MRILLDENIRSSFTDYLSPHVAIHVDALGLKGLRNGEPLDYARTNFDALLTLDRGILHQHRHEGALVILVVRVPYSTIESLILRVEEICKWLEDAKSGDRAEI